MKNKRIYTLFLMPNGDEIPLSWRTQKSLNEFKKEHKEYELIKKSGNRLYFETANRPENKSDLERLLDLFSRHFEENGEYCVTN